MSTQIEIDAYFICLKNNVKTIYWPFNWDNPFGKMYLPTFKFSIGLCWGSQMKNWMTKLDAFRMTQEIPHPRLSYLLDVHMKRKNNKKNIVLVALSQKPGTSFFFLIEAISKLCQKKNIYIKFIVRPHPYEPLNSNILNNYLIDNLNIEIDKVYIQILSKYTKNIIPASFEEIQSKLDKSLIDNLRLARLVITEAGTITAESLALDIPVISLMNNYTNQTMRTHVHATHFSSITNNKNLLMIFSNEGIDDKLNQFLDSVHFFDDNQKVETFNKVPEIINLSNLKKKIKYL